MDSKIQLVQRFTKGDLEAFHLVYGMENKRLSRFILRCVSSEDSATDLFQEVWIRAWDNRRKLKNPASFCSWLYQIARNIIREHYREKQQLNSRFEVTDSEILEGFPDKSPGPDRKLILKEWNDILECEIRKLDLAAQQMLALRFQVDLTMREISEVMRVPLGSVCAKISRSLKTIRNNMKNQGIQIEL